VFSEINICSTQRIQKWSWDMGHILRWYLSC